MIGIYQGIGVAKNSVLKIKETLRDFQPIFFENKISVNIKVLIVPGGKASEISLSMGKTLLNSIKKFVEMGGVYIGICAGAYLAIKGYWIERTLTNELILIETEHPEIDKWDRGKGWVSVRFLDEKLKEKLGETTTLWYENGPIFSRGNYKTLAIFEDEINENDSKINMYNSPAIISKTVNKGKVILFSPHPEFSKEGKRVLVNIVKDVI